MNDCIYIQCINNFNQTYILTVFNIWLLPDIVSIYKQCTSNKCICYDIYVKAIESGWSI